MEMNLPLPRSLLMAAHPIYVGKSMEVRSGRDPLGGLENRRPKGYAGSSPVPSAIPKNLCHKK